MTANSYFEYVLTLLGWLVNNGVWQTLTATGLFALPLLAKLIALWLKARGQGLMKATSPACWSSGWSTRSTAPCW